MPDNQIVHTTDIDRLIRELRSDEGLSRSPRLTPGPYTERSTAEGLTQTSQAPSGSGVNSQNDVLSGYRDPLMTSRQRRMLSCFDTFGILGLVTLLKEMALEDDRLDVLERGMVSKPPTQNRYTLPDNKRRRIEDLVRLSKRPKLVSNRTSIVTNDDGSISINSSDSEDEENETSTSYYLQGHKIWRKIINDIDKGSESIILYYLASMPPKLIRAIICGNLPLKMQNPSFKAEVAPIVKLKPSQGVYAVAVAVNNHDKDAGHGLTLRQLMRTITVMRTYCNVGDSTSAQLAIRIDNQYGSFKRQLDYYRHKRRYGCGREKDEFGPLNSWIDKLDEMILNRTRSPNCSLEVPMQRSFCYVGLSSNVSNRARDHCAHKSSSPIIGLFSATLKFLYKDRFDLHDHSYQLLRTVNSRHIGLDEVLITMLSSGHWWDGGLNLGHTGTHASSNSMSDTHDPDIADNSQYYRKLGCQSTITTTALAKVKTMHALLNQLKPCDSAPSDDLNDKSTELLKQAQLNEKQMTKLQALDELNDIEIAISQLETI